MLLPTVLVTGHIWLFWSATSDYEDVSAEKIPHPENQLESHQQIPSKTKKIQLALIYSRTLYLQIWSNMD